MKEKILMRLSMDLETFQAHLKRLNRKGYDIHPLDIDLLQQKTRAIYDQLFELEQLSHPLVKEDEGQHSAKEWPDGPEIIPHRQGEKTSETIRQAEVAATPENTAPNAEQAEVIPAPAEVAEPEVKAEHPPKKENELLPSPSSENREPDMIIEAKAEPAQLAEAIQKETIRIPEPPPTKTTVDLFTASAEATVSDKFLASEEKNVAEKMQQRNFTDLRQEIGINEKFLFINELFNGNMGKYNKAIDELNELKTGEGIHAYFIELKVSNQWQESNEAYKKLKQLLDRKLN